MSLIRDACRAEILGGLAERAKRSCTCSWRRTPACWYRLNARVTHLGRERDQAAREFGLGHVDEAVAAAARQPGGTLMLRSDRLTPAGLADEVLARTDLPQVHGDSEQVRQARSLGSKDT